MKLGHTYPVNFNVTISVATSKQEASLIDKDAFNDRKFRTASSDQQITPKYLSVQYNLFDKSVDAQVDVIYTSNNAKVFINEQEPRIIRTWNNKDLNWISVNHIHQVEMNREKIIKLAKHVMNAKICDGKMALMKKTRSDRFKNLINKDILEEENMSQVLLKEQCDIYLEKVHKSEVLNNPLPLFTRNKLSIDGNVCYSEVSRHSTDFNITTSADTEVNSDDKEKSRSDQFDVTEFIQVPLTQRHQNMSNISYGQLANLAGIDHPNELLDKRERNKSVLKHYEDTSSKNPSDIKKLKNKKTDSTIKSLPVQKDFVANIQMRSHMQNIPKNKLINTATVSTNYAEFFYGKQVIMIRLSKTNSSIKDAFVTISIDRNLLSEDLCNSLNPMIILVKSVKNIISNKDIITKSQTPIYVKYDLLDTENTTKIKEAEQNIYFEDYNVILTGLYNKKSLKELFLNNYLVFKIFDREIASIEKKQIGSIFGECDGDKDISKSNIIKDLVIEQKKYEENVKNTKRYGIARIDLSHFYYGCNIISEKLAIFNVSLDKNTKNMKKSTNSKFDWYFSKYSDNKLLSEHVDYITTGSSISVKLKLSKPIQFVQIENELQPHPYSKIVILFDMKCSDEKFMKIFCSMVEKVLHFNDHWFTVEMKWKFKQICEKLDKIKTEAKDFENCINGFSIISKKFSLILLEGNYESIHEMFEFYISLKEFYMIKKKIKILYNSEINYKTKMYPQLYLLNEIVDIDSNAKNLFNSIIKNSNKFNNSKDSNLINSCVLKINKLMQCNNFRSVQLDNLLISNQEYETIKTKYHEQNSEILENISNYFNGAKSIPILREEMIESNLNKSDNYIYSRGITKKRNVRNYHLENLAVIQYLSDINVKNLHFYYDENLYREGPDAIKEAMINKLKIISGYKYRIYQFGNYMSGTFPIKKMKKPIFVEKKINPFRNSISRTLDSLNQHSRRNMYNDYVSSGIMNDAGEFVKLERCPFEWDKRHLDWNNWSTVPKERYTKNCIHISDYSNEFKKMNLVKKSNFKNQVKKKIYNSNKIIEELNKEHFLHPIHNSEKYVDKQKAFTSGPYQSIDLKLFYNHIPTKL